MLCLVEQVLFEVIISATIESQWMNVLVLFPYLREVAAARSALAALLDDLFGRRSRNEAFSLDATS